MSDITACSGKGCPKKETCWRFVAPKGKYQSFFTEVPFKFVNDEFICDLYWKYDKS